MTGDLLATSGLTQLVDSRTNGRLKASPGALEGLVEVAGGLMEGPVGVWDAFREVWIVQKDFPQDFDVKLFRDSKTQVILEVALRQQYERCGEPWSGICVKGKAGHGLAVVLYLFVAAPVTSVSPTMLIAWRRFRGNLWSDELIQKFAELASEFGT